jgi:drug/metabolite transporter (DMT)-like permease
MITWAWIPITLFAVLMQTVRTAAQKLLTANLDPVATTLVRFLFGLPFVLLYLAAVMVWFDVTVPAIHPTFLGLALFAAVMQVVATVLLVYLFSLRNFAVGTTYARTEAFLTAVVGATLFDEWISAQGWVAIVVSVAGVLVLTIARGGAGQRTLVQRLWNRSALVGLSSGLCFALCSLSIRKASLSFHIDNFLLSAGVTLATLVVLQTFMMVTVVAARSPSQFPVMAKYWRVCLLVGLTSALGSIAWFTAMTLERASYVKALGQIEFLFALAISTLFFRERTTPMEMAGMALVGLGIIVLVLAN